MSGPGTLLVIGVGPGIGAALVRRFAAAGFATAMVARTTDHTSLLAGEIIGAGGKALAQSIDITEEREVAALFARTEEKLGPVNVAVFNASFRLQKPFAEIEIGDFQQTLDINFKGAFLMAREAARRMVPRGLGSIFFTGAQSTFRGRANLAAFGMAKAGTRGLALSMAQDLSPMGIRVVNFNIDGPVDNPKTRAREPGLVESGHLIDPATIAELYYRTHSQTPDEWTFDVHIRPGGG